MSEENTITLTITKKEQDFLILLLSKLPIQVTVENIQPLEEMASLIAKLNPLKSDDAEDTIIAEED